MIISAFGDPGLENTKKFTSIPKNIDPKKITKEQIKDLISKPKKKFKKRNNNI